MNNGIVSQMDAVNAAEMAQNVNSSREYNSLVKKLENITNPESESKLSSRCLVFADLRQSP